MSLPYFLSRRINGGGTDKNSVSRPAIRIATIGVAIGIAVMMISVSVVMGFKSSITEKVTGFGGHVQMASTLTHNTSQRAPIHVSDSLMSQLQQTAGVTHAERYAYTQGILKTDTDFLGVMFKGVGEEWDSTFISNNMRQGTLPSFSSKENGGNIVISQSIANKLHLTVGERIFAYFVNDGALRARRFTVKGIYETNLSQFDETTCFTDLYTCVRLNAWEKGTAEGVELTLSDPNMADSICPSLIDAVKKVYDRRADIYSAKTVRSLNPQIFAWLDLLDLNVVMILIIMICVSAVTIVSGLLIIILERTQMIGTLKALGARNMLIQRTFITFGSFIIIRGLLWGNAFALTLLTIQKYFGVMKLDPDTYYVNSVPVVLDITAFAILNGATLLLAVMIMVIPSFLVSHIKPAKAIKFD